MDSSAPPPERSPERGDEYRLDELARRAGVASTTVRLYQARGLLDPPRLAGRTGWYNDAHLRRLQLVARLQSDGYSLAGIADLLERWQDGQSLDALVGVEVELDALLGERNAVTLGADELLARFPAAAMTPDLIQRASALGLVSLADDGSFRVADRRFLDAGSALAALGVPIAAVLDEWEQLVEHTDHMAARFIALFERELMPADWRDGLDADAAAELATTLARLQALARQVVVAALDASLARTGRARLGELLPGE